jgi:ubiquinone/menaquinone biosynthesis C-methylase UbiE
MASDLNDYSANVERFSGFADVYDRYRPQPPAVLAAVLTGLANAPVPSLVVDLGSGTGLSTRYWAGVAHSVIGVEPTADMRRQAEAATRDENVSYREGFAHATGLTDAAAQIVTCMQSFHWMEPQSTLAEVQRILQTGGVFAACDYDWPPTTGAWEADKAFEECLRRAHELQAADPETTRIQRWEKERHLERIQACKRFRYVKEIVLHHVDRGNAERLVGLALSQGGVMTLLKRGVTETELGLAQLKAIANRVLGDEDREWYWSARVRIGVK